MKFNLYSFSQTTLKIITFSAIFLIFALNLFFTASVSYDANEKVSFEKSVFWGMLTLILCSLLVMLLSKIRNVFEKVNLKATFLLLTGIYTIIALYLVINVDPIIRADTEYIFKAAQNVTNGIFDDFKSGGYIDRYPQQRGFMLFVSLMQKISNSPKVLFITNFVFVIGINYLLCKTSNQLFNNKTTTFITIIFSFAFLPQLFFILFAYSLIPGFFFMVSAFYNTLKFTSTANYKNMSFAVISLSVSVCFKQNFLIGAIAILIYLLLQILKDIKSNKKYIIAFLCFCICLFIPTKLIGFYYNTKTEIPLAEGTPSVLWIAMGTDIDNRISGPGWYNSYNYETYTNAEYDSEKAAKTGKEGLKQNIAKMKSAPSKTMHFFIDKTISQWCEPMFQSIWSGPLEDCKQFTHTRILKSIYNGGKLEHIIALFSKTLVLAILFFSLSVFGFDKNIISKYGVFLLFFLGGLLFHTIWEGKSQYIYPYVFTLIPLAAYGIQNSLTKFNQKNLKHLTVKSQKNAQ